MNDIDAKFFKRDHAKAAMDLEYKCKRCGKGKFHNWITPEETVTVSCDACHMTVEIMPPSFIRWWKKHRHSGYAEDGLGQAQWGAPPPEAWKCDCYRTEFSGDTGYFYHNPKNQYDATVIEQWAQDQKKADDAVAAFAKAHNGREIPTLEELRAGIRGHLAKMRAEIMAKSKDAKQFPEPKYWDKEAGSVETMSAGEINARRSKLANQADAIKAKYEPKA